MKPEALLEQIKDLLADEATDKEALATSLAQLSKQYERHLRQLNRLVKLSDANEAKLTEANSKLGKITQNLSRFVPETVVSALMRDGEEQLPRNKREEITVFFSDIVGFTSITERLEPEQLARLMTDYFTEMAMICSRWGGTLDQFIGDAIVIFFGAPQSKGPDNDARAAVAMALEMQEKLQLLRMKWADEGVSLPIHVRMGLSTGYCNVGNFGSTERLHYTAIGNVVNEASRIQALCDPDSVLLSEDTSMLVRSHFRCQEVMTTTLQGRKHEVTLYQAQANQDGMNKAIITDSGPGYRLYLDTASLEDKKEVSLILKEALAQIEIDSF